MSKARFFLCKHCGNLIYMVRASGVPVICCGEPMIELVPGSVDASHEKHVPVVTVNGSAVSVKVGSVEHPMIAEHYIEWIALETETAIQIKYLKPGEKPAAEFVSAEKPVAVYAHCNIHGLWKTEL